jgi:hypothetical protein
MNLTKNVAAGIAAVVLLAAVTARGDVNDTWDWKNDPATGNPMRKLAVAFDASISNFLAATGYSLEDIVQEAAANWNQHTSVSGWEFVFTNNAAAADVVIVSADSPVPDGGAHTSRGTNSSGVVIQARLYLDPTPQAKKRDTAGKPMFDPGTGKQVVEDLTWGTNGVGVLDLITVTKHEFTHLLRKGHHKDASGKEVRDTGNLTDPVSQGNHQREPSGADVTNITISATQAVKTAVGTVAPGVGDNIVAPKTQTSGAGLLVPSTAATNGMALFVTPREGIALPEPDGLWPAFGRVALGVEIASSPAGGQFANAATATLSYADALWQDLHAAAVDESTLQPFRFNPGTQTWEPIPLLSRDPVGNTISFPVSNLNFTVYGIAGRELMYTNTHALVPYVSDGGSAWTNFDIYALDPQAGMTARLTTDPAIDNHPDISPDRKWLVWSSTRANGDFDLYLGDLTNVEATARPLTSDSYPHGTPTPYPDRHPHFHTHNSRLILFTSKNLPLDTPVQIVSECSQPTIIVPPRPFEQMNVITLTPEGNADTYTELDVRDAWDEAGRPGIWTNNTCTYVGHPSFSHSGTQIVFSASIDGNGKVWEVYTVGFDTNALALIPNSLRRVTSGPVVGSNPIQMSGGAHFSEDDSEIYFSSTRTPNGNSLIFSVPAGSEDVPVTNATPRTSHPGNDYVPEPLEGGGFLVTSDLGEPGVCGQTNGPTRDLDIVQVSSAGARANLTDNDAGDEMALIGDEVSWFCGLPPNLSACRSVPRIYSIESLWLERGAWQYLKGLAPWTLIPDDLLAKHGYPDQAVRMYALGWMNMEAVMAGEHAGWPDILFHLQLMDSAAASFPGLTNGPALQNWMQMTQPVRNMKIVSESLMYDRGIGRPWAPWVSTWTNANGGEFSAPGNWDLDRPRSNDTARFDGRVFDVVPTGRVVRVDITNRADVTTIEIEMVQLNLTSVLTNRTTVSVSTNITISLSSNTAFLVVSNIDLSVTNAGKTGRIQIGTNGTLKVQRGEVRTDRLIMGSGSRLEARPESFFDIFVPVDLPHGPIPPQITVSSGGVFRAPGIKLGGNGGTGSTVRVEGELIVTNAAGTGTVAVAGGTLTIAGGTVTVDRLVVTGLQSKVSFAAGLLSGPEITVSNGSPFEVGFPYGPTNMAEALEKAIAILKGTNRVTVHGVFLSTFPPAACGSA